MKFRRSIKFNVWARFEAIVIAMLAFTYVFLIVLFVVLRVDENL